MSLLDLSADILRELAIYLGYFDFLSLVEVCRRTNSVLTQLKLPRLVDQLKSCKISPLVYGLKYGKKELVVFVSQSPNWSLKQDLDTILRSISGVNVLEWLQSRGYLGLELNVDAAAQNKDSRVLCWLIDRHYSFSSTAALYASSTGILANVQSLRTLGIHHPLAFGEAVKNDHTEVAKYLYLMGCRLRRGEKYSNETYRLLKARFPKIVSDTFKPLTD